MDNKTTLALIVVISLAFYLLDKYIVQPLKIRLKYSKYKNVYINEKFSPIHGERYLVKKWEREEKYRFWHLMQVAMDNPGWDIRIIFSGPKPLFLIYSAKAWEEFHRLIPMKIDRHANHLKHFGRITEGGIEQIRSTKFWKIRRDKIMKVVGVNFSTKFLPLMIESFDKISSTWKVNQWIDLANEMQKITFDIISKILFGNDITEKEILLSYTESDGQKTLINLCEYFSKLISDLELSASKIRK